MTIFLLALLAFVPHIAFLGLIWWLVKKNSPHASAERAMWKEYKKHWR